MKTKPIIESFYRIHHKFEILEKQKIKLANGIMIHRKELHTIELIGGREGINITGLAKLQGVTKGAVSQMITRLEAKSLVNKRFSPETENEVVLYLTELGQQVYQLHEQQHAADYALMIQHIQRLTPEVKSEFVNVMGKLEQILDKRLEMNQVWHKMED